MCIACPADTCLVVDDVGKGYRDRIVSTIEETLFITVCVSCKSVVVSLLKAGIFILIKYEGFNLTLLVWSNKAEILLNHCHEVCECEVSSRNLGIHHLIECHI